MTEDNLNEQNNCDFSDISILVVEDDLTSGILLSRILETTNPNKMDFAKNSDQALELFQTNKYDLVLNGYDFIWFTI